MVEEGEEVERGKWGKKEGKGSSMWGEVGREGRNNQRGEAHGTEGTERKGRRCGREKSPCLLGHSIRRCTETDPIEDLRS